MAIQFRIARMGRMSNTRAWEGVPTALRHLCKGGGDGTITACHEPENRPELRIEQSLL